MGKVIVWLLVLALAPITWAGDIEERERVERSRELSQQLQQQLQKLNMQNDMATKATDKSAQGTQTLMKNQ